MIDRFTIVKLGFAQTVQNGRIVQHAQRSRKFQFLFGATGLTRYGGLLLFHLFCKSLALRRFLQTYVSWPDYTYRDYHPTDLFLAHLFAVVAGIGRIENTQSLIHNGLLPPLLGLPNFPHRDTLEDHHADAHY